MEILLEFLEVLDSKISANQNFHDHKSLIIEIYKDILNGFVEV